MVRFGKKRKYGGFIAGVLLCSPLLLMIISIFLVELGFTQDVSGRLKRAADANSVKIAKKELKAALRGMETRGVTSGRSNVFLYTPDCDISFWHDNIESAYDELVALPSDADQLTVSNQLMKLRETLLDDDGAGVVVTLPPNIVIFPNGLLWAIGWVVVIILCGAGLLIFILQVEG